MAGRQAKRTHSVGEIDVGSLLPDSGLADVSLVPSSAQVRKKSKQTKTKNISAQAMDDAIDTVLSQRDCDMITGHNISNVTVINLHDQVIKLQTVVNAQTAEIARLNQKLSYILKYLEIPDEIPDAIVSKDHVTGAVAVGLPGKSDSGANGSSYAAVTKFKLSPQTARAAAVAAVYIEQNAKKRRSSSLVVSGLKPEQDLPDRQMFIMLCETEFNVCPEVVATKRLGQPKTDSIQPLLVTLSDEDTTTLLVEHARSLRKSTNPYVRANVYLNANLTRAEAAASFQIRQQRRAAAARRQSGKQSEDRSSSSGSALMSSSSAAGASSPHPVQLKLKPIQSTSTTSANTASSSSSSSSAAVAAAAAASSHPVGSGPVLSTADTLSSSALTSAVQLAALAAIPAASGSSASAALQYHRSAAMAPPDGQTVSGAVSQPPTGSTVSQ